MTSSSNKVKFTAMEHGTQADYDLVFAHGVRIAAEQADRVLQWLRELDGESPYQISRLDHSLQTASGCYGSVAVVEEDITRVSAYRLTADAWYGANQGVQFPKSLLPGGLVEPTLYRLRALRRTKLQLARHVADGLRCAVIVSKHFEICAILFS